MFEQYNDIMTVAEVSEALLVGKNRVYDMIKHGEIKHIKFGKIIKVPKASLIEYVITKSGLNKNVTPWN